MAPAPAAGGQQRTPGSTRSSRAQEVLDDWAKHVTSELTLEPQARYDQLFAGMGGLSGASGHSARAVAVPGADEQLVWLVHTARRRGAAALIQRHGIEQVDVAGFAALPMEPPHTVPVVPAARGDAVAAAQSARRPPVHRADRGHQTWPPAGVV